jgi:hypothetical protein
MIPTANQDGAVSRQLDGKLPHLYSGVRGRNFRKAGRNAGRWFGGPAEQILNPGRGTT